MFASLRPCALSLCLLALNCAGDDSATSKTSTATGSTSPTSSTGGDSESTGGDSESSTGVAGCGSMACAACAACMQAGTCADLYTTCSADQECLDYVTCMIPTCIEQGQQGEACAETCGAALANASNYMSCVMDVCNPSCGFPS